MNVRHLPIFPFLSVPTLSTSTSLLVAQYINGTAVGGESPNITCSPSDARAPVQWSIFPLTHTFEDFNVDFLPTGLNHTVRFPTYYSQLPSQTVTFTCDLINVEEPGVEVDPQQTTVRLVQSKLFEIVHVHNNIFTCLYVHIYHFARQCTHMCTLTRKWDIYS